MILIILVLAVFIFLFFSIRLANDNHKNNDAIHNYLVNHNNELYKLIEGMITEENLKRQLENLFSYEMFRESCMEYILDSVVDYVESSGTRWIKFDSNLDLSNFQKLDVYEATIEILEDKEIDNMIANIFVDRVTKNIKEAESIEKEAAAYHKSFGSEPHGEPELHKKENDPDQVDVIKEYGLNDLMNTGTIEDIE